MPGDGRDDAREAPERPNHSIKLSFLKRYAKFADLAAS